jgi:virginiamycin B lyase
MTALRRPGWLAAAVVTIAVLAAAAGYFAFGVGSRPQFVEYPMQEPQDMPIGIAAAGDGTVWFSIGGADAIGRVRDGQLERLPKPGKSVEPIGIGVAPDGSAWYTDIAAHAVSRMTPSGEVSSFRLSTPMVRLGRLAVAPDGAAWFAESSSQSITRLNEGELTRHQFQSPLGGP